MAQAPHVPTEQSRRQAELLSGIGLPHRMIAKLLGIAEGTLRAHYTDDLELGEAKATAKVAQTLYHRAVEGKELSAMIFWLKARAGWRERHLIEHAPDQSLAEALERAHKRVAKLRPSGEITSTTADDPARASGTSAGSRP